MVFNKLDLCDRAAMFQLNYKQQEGNDEIEITAKDYHAIANLQKDFELTIIVLKYSESLAIT